MFHVFLRSNQTVTLKRGDALENAGFDDCTHYGVHPGTIAARREDSELHFSVMIFCRAQ